MEYLRRLWEEERHQLYLWVLGSLLFTAITAGLGLRGTFSARAHGGKPGSEQPVQKEPRAPARGL